MGLINSVHIASHWHLLGRNEKRNVIFPRNDYKLRTQNTLSMVYKSIKPQGHAAAIVSEFWQYEHNGPKVREAILPDGCMDIIVNLGVATSAIAKNTVVVCGMMGQFQNRDFYEGTLLFGIRLHLGQLSWLTHMPLIEFKNQVTGLGHANPALGQGLVERLASCQSFGQRARYAEQWVLAHALPSLGPRHRTALAMASCLAAVDCPIRIGVLADRFHMGLRQLERCFQEYIGLSAKTYQQVARFQHAAQAIAALPNESLLGIACQTGYHDHAHMAGAFQKIAGMPPSAFR